MHWQSDSCPALQSMPVTRSSFRTCPDMQSSQIYGFVSLSWGYIVILCRYFSGKGRCGKNALSWLVGSRISRSSWARLNNTFKSSWGRNRQCSVNVCGYEASRALFGTMSEWYLSKNSPRSIWDPEIQISNLVTCRHLTWQGSTAKAMGPTEPAENTDCLFNSECLGMWNNTFETWNSVPLSGLLLIFCTERAQTFRPHLIFLKPCYPKI